MRVARLHGPGVIEVHDEPTPVPAGDEVLVRVGAVGVCGSDLHWFADGAIGDAALTRPLVLGHEMAGVIASGPRAGQRVAIDPAVPCFACRACRAGHPNLCERIVFAGHGPTDGGMREYLAWPAHRLHPLPASMDEVDGALLEPLGVAVHAMDLAHLRLASTVAVVGCGPIGLLAVQLARLAGARIIVAVEPLAHRRALAAELGATHAVAPAEAAATVAAATDGWGVDVVIELAGTDAAVAMAIDVVRPGARVVLGGIPDGDRTSFSASAARRKGLTFLMVRRMKEVYERAIALVDSGAVDVRRLVTERRSLDETADALKQAAARTGVKTVITP
ncbi:MAG TPA: alcohol dehydrogenase catalytic domain-containing protein [Jatrophihabitantaceae bacterium]